MRRVKELGWQRVNLTKDVRVTWERSCFPPENDRLNVSRGFKATLWDGFNESTNVSRFIRYMASIPYKSELSVFCIQHRIVQHVYSYSGCVFSQTVVLTNESHETSISHMNLSEANFFLSLHKYMINIIQCSRNKWLTSIVHSSQEESNDNNDNKFICIFQCIELTNVALQFIWMVRTCLFSRVRLKTHPL